MQKKMTSWPFPWNARVMFTEFYRVSRSGPSIVLPALDDHHRVPINHSSWLDRNSVVHNNESNGDANNAVMQRPRTVCFFFIFSQKSTRKRPSERTKKIKNKYKVQRPPFVPGRFRWSRIEFSLSVAIFFFFHVSSSSAIRFFSFQFFFSIFSSFREFSPSPPPFPKQKNKTRFESFYLVLLGFTGFYLFLLSLTWFYLVLPGFTECYLVLLGFT